MMNFYHFCWSSNKALMAGLIRGNTVTFKEAINNMKVMTCMDLRHSSASCGDIDLAAGYIIINNFTHFLGSDASKFAANVKTRHLY